jgi:hypothetical protein
LPRWIRTIITGENNVKTTVAVGSAVGPLLPGICNAFFEVGAENRPQGTKLVMRLAKAF